MFSYSGFELYSMTKFWRKFLTMQIVFINFCSSKIVVYRTVINFWQRHKWIVLLHKRPSLEYGCSIISQWPRQFKGPCHFIAIIGQLECVELDLYREKGKYLTQSYNKSPYTHRKKIQKQHDSTKTPPKTSITQRLQTGLGRSVGVTIDTQLVNGIPIPHSPQRLCDRGHEYAGTTLQ